MYEPIKKLGQNFLTDQRLAGFMVDSLLIGGGEAVVEIGPGLGALTLKIAEKIEDTQSELFAVEIDERFTEKLLEMFIGNEKLFVIKEDILKWLPEFSSGKPIKVIGSLPYYITSPILHTIVKMKKLPELCVLLVQKEVAQKITKEAPDASYLSVFINTFFSAEILEVVPKGSFAPVPEVDGAVIKLSKKPQVISEGQVPEYENFLHEGFKFPRKMLNKVFKPEFLNMFGVSAKERPQDIATDIWIKMFSAREARKSI